MIDQRFIRSAKLLGEDSIEVLSKKHIAVFGIGGVGSFVVEGLVRTGIGNIDIIDDDVVSLSNINRQLIATTKTLGQAKVDIMEQRAKDINPNVNITSYKCFYTAENSCDFDFSKYDYIVDAIDTVSAKIEIIMQAKKTNTPVISSMGTGNKLDPTRFEITDIYKTSVCPLARVMRKEMKTRAVKKLKVLYSKEESVQTKDTSQIKENLTDTPQRKGNPKKQTPGSLAFVPSVAGMIIAGEVIKDLTIKSKDVTVKSLKSDS